MWPVRVSNPGPLTYEPGALPTALCGPAGTGECPFCNLENLIKVNKQEQVCRGSCISMVNKHSKTYRGILQGSILIQ